VATVPIGGDFSHRPELTAASERERAARAEIKGAKSGYQPRVSAFGSLDHDYGWVTGGDGNSYSAGVMLQWDLWDGFSSRSKTREAKANLESASEEKRKLRLALDFEVEQARLNLQAANERLAVTEKSVEQAEESAKLTRGRFEQGMAISTQLIDAESALVAARVRRAESESDQRIAVAALRKALALPQLDAQPTAK
jgi:outer membrane protein TolC